MVDKLDIEITNTRTRIAEHEAAIEREKLRLEAMEFAASARPNVSTGKNSIRSRQKPSTGNGRKEGSISFPWRDVLWQMNKNIFAEATSETDVLKFAADRGIAGNERSYRQRLKRFVAQDLLSWVDNEYRVTPLAIEMFDLTDADRPSDRARGKNEIGIGAAERAEDPDTLNNYVSVRGGGP